MFSLKFARGTSPEAAWNAVERAEKRGHKLERVPLGMIKTAGERGWDIGLLDEAFKQHETNPSDAAVDRLRGKVVVTNKVFAATNQQFRQACSKAGVQPTRRQASKYRAGTGAAFELEARDAQAQRVNALLEA